MKIIMISGKQGSGKTTLSNSLQKILPNVYRTRFAKVLYEMHDAAIAVAARYGIPVNKKEGEMLQWIGTEWGRVLKGNNVWVNAARQELVNNAVSTMYNFTLIDDLRFVNEFHAFDDYPDVLKVRLEAPKEARQARADYWRENDSHPSETGLDEYAAQGKFDLVLNTQECDAQQVLGYVLSHLETSAAEATLKSM